jgi:hypothetical protein
LLWEKGVGCVVNRLPQTAENIVYTGRRERRAKEREKH